MMTLISDDIIKCFTEITALLMYKSSLQNSLHVANINN